MRGRVGCDPPRFRPRLVYCARSSVPHPEPPMPITTVYKAQIDYLQSLDEQGHLDEKLAKDTLSDEDVVYLYEQMTIGRTLDEIAFKLQRSGRMGTYPQNKGQEACAAGS